LTLSASSADQALRVLRNISYDFKYIFTLELLRYLARFDIKASRRSVAIQYCASLRQTFFPASTSINRSLPVLGDYTKTFEISCFTDSETLVHAYSMY
jgi:hypothetical protein